MQKISFFLADMIMPHQFVKPLETVPDSLQQVRPMELLAMEELPRDYRGINVALKIQSQSDLGSVVMVGIGVAIDDLVTKDCGTVSSRAGVPFDSPRHDNAGYAFDRDWPRNWFGR